jgi:hypothetical protein
MFSLASLILYSLSLHLHSTRRGVAQHGIIVAALEACNISSSKAEATYRHTHTGRYILC